MKRYDFIVVGGGPVGCQTAIGLAKSGHQVAVLEKEISVGGRACCTGIVSRECLGRYSIPSELVLKELKSASVFSPGGKLLHIERAEMQAAVLDRGAFNAHMARGAQEAGADYLMSRKVTSVKSRPDGVIAKVENQGKEEFFEARALVLACGFGSKLPQQIGIETGKKWVVGAQAEVEAPDLKEVEIYLGRSIAPGYFAWLVPTGGSTALAGLMTREHADHRLESLLMVLKDKGRIEHVTGKSCFRGITIQPIQSFSNRILLAGDAAGQVKPLTGGGIYFGLLCADIAADTLHSAMETGDFSVAKLSAYQKQWNDILGSELRLGGWGHSIYKRLSDARLDWVFEKAHEKRLSESLAASQDISFDWHGRAILQVLKKLVFSGHNKAGSDRAANAPLR